MNFILVMRNEKADLVAIGPVSIEYQAAMLRDELEESARLDDRRDRQGADGGPGPPRCRGLVTAAAR